jgi:hypothetical protein
VTLEAGKLNHEQPALSESIGMTAELLEGVFTPCHWPVRNAARYIEKCKANTESLNTVIRTRGI